MGKVNASRSRTVLKILQENYEMSRTGTDKTSALTDLLTDIYHFAAYHNIELHVTQNAAYLRFSAERQQATPRG